MIDVVQYYAFMLVFMVVIAVACFVVAMTFMSLLSRFLKKFTGHGLGPFGDV